MNRDPTKVTRFRIHSQSHQLTDSSVCGWIVALFTAIRSAALPALKDQPHVVLYRVCFKKNGTNLVRNSTGIASQRFATPHSGKTQGLFAGSPPVRSGFWEFPRSRNANVTSRYKDILVESPVDSQNYRFFHGFFKQSWNMPDCG